MSAPRRAYFVDFSGWLEAALDQGVNLEDAIKELMDNSSDGGASRINIVLETVTKWNKGEQLKGIRLTVVDDGRGMPRIMTDQDGVEFEGLPFAMSFGGRHQEIVTNGKTKVIGRFGEGLSASISCNARVDGCAKVWTKQKSDSAWRSVAWEYSEIISDNCMLPKESEGEWPIHLPFGRDNGTVVMIETYEDDCGKLRLGSLQKRILQQAARTYRHRMATDGMEIVVSVIPEGGWKNGSHKKARIRDPLCRLPDSEEVTMFGQAKEYDQIVLEFDGKEDSALEGFPELLDEDGNPHQIKIDVTWVKPSAVRRVLFDRTEGLSKKAKDRLLAEWGFGGRGQGFSFIREGREIVGDRSKGLYLRQDPLNYMHGEVHFPAHRVIDDLFGIQTNKSRFDIDPELRDILKEQIAPILTQIRTDVEDASSTRGSLQASVGETEEERGLRSLSNRLPIPIYTESDLEEGERFRKEAREKMEQVLQNEHEGQLVILRNKRLDESISEVELEDAEFELKQQLLELMSQNERRYGTAAPVRFEVREADDCEGSAIYVSESRGDECVVWLQPTSPLITHIKDGAGDDRIAKALRLMLGGMAYAEHLDCSVDESRRKMWGDIREDVSRRAHEFLKVMGEQLMEESQ